MKKIYATILVLLLGFTSVAQTDPDLLGQWYLHYIEINSVRTYVPPVTNNPNVYITFNNDANPGLPTTIGDSSCNTFISNYEVNNTNTSVNLISVNPTLLLCTGDTFETTYLSILGDSTTNFFDYTIDIPNESLTMIDLLGVKLVYGRQILSTEEQKINLNILKLYPNPATKTLFIADFSADSHTKYSIHDFTGKRIISEKKLNQNSIDINNLKPGVYFLKVSQQGKISVKKFIKV